jgi:hypothetical protein
MAYITKSNSKRILRKINLSQISGVEGEVYKKPIYFLSNYETKYLLLMQSLLKDPEKFAIEVYQPVTNKDTLTYVYESEQPPAYHTNKDCEKLHASFKNFQIPFEVKQRVQEQGGEELVKLQVLKFRDWFKKHFDLFQKDSQGFLRRLDIDWNIQRSVSEIDKENSGTENIENYRLEDLEKEIDKIISEAGKFFNSNPDKQNIIRRFQKLTFLAYKSNPIDKNDTGFSDEELKKFLQFYDEKFKKPVKKFLIEYYRVKYNPELSFEGELLERLNFKECSLCNGTAENNYVIDSALRDDSSLDDLPF